MRESIFLTVERLRKLVSLLLEISQIFVIDLGYAVDTHCCCKYEAELAKYCGKNAKIALPMIHVSNIDA